MLNETVDLGSQVPAICSHPECATEITRGQVNICGTDPAGGECCGMPFCGAHLQGPGQTCERCAAGEPPFEMKADQPDMTDAQLTGSAWKRWRADNPDRVMALAAKKGQQMREAHAVGHRDPTDFGEDE